LSINVPRQQQNGQLQTSNNNNDFYESRHHEICSDLLLLCTSLAAQHYSVSQKSVPIITCSNYASGWTAKSSNGQRKTKKMCQCNLLRGAAVQSGPWPLHSPGFLIRYDTIRYDIYLLQPGFHPVVVDFTLAHKRQER